MPHEGGPHFMFLYPNHRERDGFQRCILASVSLLWRDSLGRRSQQEF